VSALMAGWYLYSTGRNGCDNAATVAGEAQVRGALAALKQMKTDMAEVGKFSAADQEEITTTIEDYEALLNHQNPGAAGPPGPAAKVDTGDPGRRLCRLRKRTTRPTHRNAPWR